MTTDVNSYWFCHFSHQCNTGSSHEVLNEMYTNPDVVNLLDWGIEGVHYEKQDDGTIDFPEGVDANTTTYGLNMDWFFGNQFLSYIWGKGRDTTIYSRLEENQTRIPSFHRLWDFPLTVRQSLLRLQPSLM